MRRGRIGSYEPHSFAASLTVDQIRIRLPLEFYNTGARAIVVQNLRLRFLNEPSAERPMPWQTTRKALAPEHEDIEDFATPFAIAGRSVKERIIEFGSRTDIVPLGKDFPIEIQAKLAHKEQWQTLIRFPLRTGNITKPRYYLAYSNDADFCPWTIGREPRRRLSSSFGL